MFNWYQRLKWLKLDQAFTFLLKTLKAAPVCEEVINEWNPGFNSVLRNVIVFYPLLLFDKPRPFCVAFSCFSGTNFPWHPLLRFDSYFSTKPSMANIRDLRSPWKLFWSCHFKAEIINASHPRQHDRQHYRHCQHCHHCQSWRETFLSARSVIVIAFLKIVRWLQKRPS